jgi:hypothetical protein
MYDNSHDVNMYVDILRLQDTAIELPVTGVQVGTYGEMAVDNLGKIVLAHIAECFRKIINNEPVMISKQLVAHLGNLPAREIEVQTVDERHVIADNVGHRREKMACLNHDIDGLIGGLAETAPLNDRLSQRYRNKPPQIEGKLAESSTLHPRPVPLRRGILAQVGAQGNACRKLAESARP